MALHPAHAIGVCSGYGGIDLGLRLALGERCRTVLYCEREAYSAATLVSAMEAGLLDAAPVWSDLRTLPAGDIVGRLGIDPAGIILHGGIPCQPWSTAGRRRRSADKRWLWPAFWRVVQDNGLGWIFLENVRGFVSGADSGLDLVLRDLSRAGWDAEWDLFSAEECGAPHRRERVFVLAHAPGIGRRQARAELPRRGGDAAPADGGSGELADRHCGRRQLPPLSAGSANERGGTLDPVWSGDYWPSRPGEQHPWEPPRVVVYAKGAGHKRRDGHAVPGQAGAENAVAAEQGPQAESGLGGGADGAPAVMDQRFASVWAGRLSALGNGVVPLVAAVAYWVLWRRLTT